MGGEIINRSCRACGKSFDQAKPKVGRYRSFCSPECKYEMRHYRAAETPCKTCGKNFSPRYVSAGFCSIECRRYPERKVWDNKDEARRFYRARRRTLKRGAGYERFNRMEIFERDNWQCGICDKPVDPTLAYPDLMSASLDHVIPLAAGGPHSRANVQCAHFLCNSLKADKVEAEAA